MLCRESLHELKERPSLSLWLVEKPALNNLALHLSQNGLSQPAVTGSGGTSDLPPFKHE
jgi:hypothetical protein